MIDPSKSKILQRRGPLRHVRNRPRLFLSFLVVILVAGLLTLLVDWRLPTRLLIAWNTGIGLYLVLAWSMMLRSSMERMKLRARSQDEGQIAMLVLPSAASVLSLVAIVAELADIHDLTGPLKLAHVVLTGVTIVTAWSFIHTIFAMHYAHEYYLKLASDPASKGGLDFPGASAPGYVDFLYFAFVIGTSGQTADIAMTSRSMRWIGLAHCILAFFFNTTILALTINIGAGLIS